MADRKKPTSKIQKEIRELYEQNELAGLKANQNRARSIACGQTTGGLIEIILRGEINTMWYLLHPVEAIEIIEQLAAACGVEILKRPKQDFSAWRSWDLEQPNGSNWMGAAPWQISDQDRKKMVKIHREKYGILPEPIEKPKLEATTKRKKKTQEVEETEE